MHASSTGGVGEGGGAAGDHPAATPEQTAAYFAAQKLFREDHYDEALDALVRLVRGGPTRPIDGALGLVVAAVASRVDRRMCLGPYHAAADAHPDDVLEQYIAGVASHYCGHLTARSRAEKAEYYRTTIRYLERVEKTYDFEPRVFVYLAVSHHRLGEEAQARAYIDRAAAVARQDPDVAYCHAEIYAATDPTQAIADIRRYLTDVERLHETEGVAINPQKHARVQAMLAHLERVARGEEKLDADLWDPVERRPQHHWGRAVPPAAALGLLGGAAFVIRRRRTR
jgi:tetratricopeptide (TPR) repeat protein